MKSKKLLVTLLTSMIAGTMVMAQTPQIQVNLFDRPINNIIYSNVINELELGLNGIDENQVELTIEGGGLIKTDKLHYAVIINQGISHPKLNVYYKSNLKINQYKSYDLVATPMDSPYFQWAGHTGYSNQITKISRGDIISNSSIYALYSPTQAFTPHIIEITNMKITINTQKSFPREFLSLNGDFPNEVLHLFQEIKSGDQVILSVKIKYCGMTYQFNDCIFEVN